MKTALVYLRFNRGIDDNVLIYETWDELSRRIDLLVVDGIRQHPDESLVSLEVFFESAVGGVRR